MRWPLWDDDCRKCHERFDESEGDSWRRPRFHQLAVHNVALGVDCVACHQVHAAGGNPDAYFLEAAHVRGQCALCHSEFAGGAEPGRPPRPPGGVGEAGSRRSDSAMRDATRSHSGRSDFTTREATTLDSTRTDSTTLDSTTLDSTKLDSAKLVSRRLGEEAG